MNQFVLVFLVVLVLERNLFIYKQGIVRFMESPHDFFVAHWDHEPDWTISCRICNTNLSERFARFMGRNRNPSFENGEKF